MSAYPNEPERKNMIDIYVDEVSLKEIQQKDKQILRFEL